MIPLLVVACFVLLTFLLTWAILRWSNARKVTRRVVFVAVAAVFGTLFATLIYANAVSSGSGIEQAVTSDYGVDDPQFERAMSRLLGPPLLLGNTITTFSNGDQIFPAMLEAIRNARQTITFETFIYWEGKIGEEFAEALAQKAKAGVKVFLLLDWLGSNRMKSELLDKMKESGVRIEKYHPVKWYTLDRINNRTHRKILVVDGRVGFTGGVGIGDEWAGNAQDPEHWRDAHFRAEGPVVSQMQAAFMDNWMKTHAEVSHDETFFPDLPATGTMTAQMFKSGSEGGSSSARLMFLMSIACARKTLHIANSYFVPDSLVVKMLVEAAGRGVKVRIICPGGKTDTRITRAASRARWGDLLAAGIEIYEYQPTMFHCKYMVIDGVWCSVGSTNFDSRSFKLNDEANLNILNPEFGAEQERIFADDLSKSRLITLQEWKSRPWHKKLREKTASLLGSQL